MLDLKKVAGIGSGGWDGSTIRIEVTYEFEQSPNIPIGNYVDTTNNYHGAGFFANSGIKIENRAEIQIFDTGSLLNAIGGSSETVDGATEAVVGNIGDINSTGIVKLQHGSPAVPWSTADANRARNLISGRPYEYPLTLNASDPADTYMKRLQDAPKGTQTMIIDVSRPDVEDNAVGPYEFIVTIDGGTTTYTDVLRGDPQNTQKSMVLLQSHWGSGVKFTAFKVSKL